jgi:hypothetical protein
VFLLISLLTSIMKCYCPSGSSVMLMKFCNTSGGSMGNAIRSTALGPFDLVLRPAWCWCGGRNTTRWPHVDSPIPWMKLNNCDCYQGYYSQLFWLTQTSCSMHDLNIL